LLQGSSYFAECFRTVFCCLIDFCTCRPQQTRDESKTGKRVSRKWNQPCWGFQLRYTRSCTLFGVSLVVCDGHLGLLGPWATRLLSQSILHWWHANASSAAELFACTHPPTSCTKLYSLRGCFSNLQYGPTGNRIQRTSFGGGVQATIPFNHYLLFLWQYIRNWKLALFEQLKIFIIDLWWNKY